MGFVYLKHLVYYLSFITIEYINKTKGADLMKNKMYELMRKLHNEMQKVKLNMTTKDDIKNLESKIETGL